MPPLVETQEFPAGATPRWSPEADSSDSGHECSAVVQSVPASPGTSEMLGGHQLALRSQVLLGQTLTSETGDERELGVCGLSCPLMLNTVRDLAAGWATSCVSL